MTMIKKCDYDAIIIGAGISGLVCGCYLAKSGLRILIVEKSNKAGGCCSSFEKDGFAFDTGVFSFGDCGSNGNLRKIIEELGLNKKLALKRSNPSDVILTPSNRIVIYNDINQLIEEFMHIFPKEANSIKVFFRFLVRIFSARVICKTKRYDFDGILRQLFY
jgi:Phytoene dehydrogenase and related proteins